jgi:transcriptional/translational regulatory protein YebC/TACO1
MLPFTSFGTIQKELETRIIEILSSGFEKFLKSLKKSYRSRNGRCEKLIEKLEEDDDVMYHTMEEA